MYVLTKAFGLQDFLGSQFSNSIHCHLRMHSKRNWNDTIGIFSKLHNQWIFLFQEISKLLTLHQSLSNSLCHILVSLGQLHRPNYVATWLLFQSDALVIINSQTEQTGMTTMEETIKTDFKADGMFELSFARNPSTVLHSWLPHRERTHFQSSLWKLGGLWWF